MSLDAPLYSNDDNIKIEQGDLEEQANDLDVKERFGNFTPI